VAQAPEDGCTDGEWIPCSYGSNYPDWVVHIKTSWIFLNCGGFEGNTIGYRKVACDIFIAMCFMFSFYCLLHAFQCFGASCNGVFHAPFLHDSCISMVQNLLLWNVSRSSSTYLLPFNASESYNIAQSSLEQLRKKCIQEQGAPPCMCNHHRSGAHYALVSLLRQSIYESLTHNHPVCYSRPRFIHCIAGFPDGRRVSAYPLATISRYFINHVILARPKCPTHHQTHHHANPPSAPSTPPGRTPFPSLQAPACTPSAASSARSTVPTPPSASSPLQRSPASTSTLASRVPFSASTT